MLSPFQSVRFNNRQVLLVCSRRAQCAYLLSHYVHPALLSQLLVREDEAVNLTHCLILRPAEKKWNNIVILQPW